MVLPYILYPVIYASLAHSYSCIDFVVPVTVDSLSQTPSFKEFGNHFDSVQLLVDITTRVTEGTTSPYSGSENVTAEFAIDGSFCTPGDHYAEGQDIQILSHGVGFDKLYWHWGGVDSDYNYVRAATNAGYATLSWSRPGNGASSSGDPYTILQTDIEASVLIELTRLLRSGQLSASIPKASGRVLHIGHSFGSVISNVLIVQHPELSDGVALTGLSHDFTSIAFFATATNFHLAKENHPERFGNLSTGILTWGDELALQYGFFKHPNFDPEVLAYAEAHKWPFAISEVLTLQVPSLVATKFTGPVLVSIRSSICLAVSSSY